MANKTNSTINGKDYYRIRADVGKKPDGSRINHFMVRIKKRLNKSVTNTLIN